MVFTTEGCIYIYYVFIFIYILYIYIIFYVLIYIYIYICMYLYICIIYNIDIDIDLYTYIYFYIALFLYRSNFQRSKSCWHKKLFNFSGKSQKPWIDNKWTMALKLYNYKVHLSYLIVLWIYLHEKWKAQILFAMFSYGVKYKKKVRGNYNSFRKMYPIKDSFFKYCDELR